MHAAGAVFHRDALFAAGLFVYFDAAYAGQQIGNFAVHYVAAIELGRNIHRQPQLAPAGLHLLRLRHCAQEIATQADKGAHRAVDNAGAAFYSIQAFFTWWLEVI